MENNIKALPAGTSESAQVFEQEFLTETNPAVDTPAEVLSTTINDSSDNPLAVPPETPAQPAAEPGAPIFGQDSLAGSDAATKPEKPLTDKKSEVKLMFILKMVDKMQAKGFSRMAKEMDEQRWRFDDEEMEMLVDAWMPYMKEHGGAIPDWIEAAFVTVWVFGNRFYEAYDTRRANAQNEQIAASPSMQATVAKVVAMPAGKRKNYVLATTRPGYYQSDKNGKYLKKELVNEKASLADMEYILKDNDIEVVRAAFPNANI